MLNNPTELPFFPLTLSLKTLFYPCGRMQDERIFPRKKGARRSRLCTRLSRDE
jgi:hypothetical protein